MSNFRLVVAITGASGAIYGVKLLQLLNKRNVETHLVISKAGLLTLCDETPFSLAEVKALATHYYNYKDIGATLASGTFSHDGMVVAPCSMHTLAAIAHGFDHNLISRAATVTLKERRKLVILARETPLTLAHLANMTAATQMGAIIMPPIPAFYSKPKTIDDLISYMAFRVLDQFKLNSEIDYARWQGYKKMSE